MNNLLKYLELHSIECKMLDGKLMVVESYCYEGKHYSHWIELKPEMKIVREWLGY